LEAKILTLCNLQRQRWETTEEEVWIAGESSSSDCDRNISLALDCHSRRRRVEINGAKLQGCAIHRQIDGCSESIDDADSRPLKDDTVAEDWSSEFGDPWQDERIDLYKQVARRIWNGIVDAQI
jgi:hypothetical protein